VVNSKEVSYYCRECLSRLITPQQTDCSSTCPLNNLRRPFSNVSELVINDVKEEIRSVARPYLNIICEYPKDAITSLI
ncbi:unnamed protein product, partial [Didymodactylos carnosus]